MSESEVLELPLFDTYVQELLWLATSVRSILDAVFARTEQPGDYILVDPAVHAQIREALLNAANVAKLVNDLGPRRRNEDPSAARLRIGRARVLRGLLHDLELGEILSTDARNSYEHFAERIDTTNLRLMNAAHGPLPVLYNATISRRAVFKPNAYPMRVYVAAERKLCNFDAEIDLGLVHSQAGAIVSRLRERIPGLPSEPGGMIFMIPGTRPM